MMKSYTAYCMNEDGENLCMTREYTAKAHFISDLHGNGYKVHFVALTDKYDEESAKYYERLETKRRRAAIRRECEREWKRRDAEIQAEIKRRVNEENQAEEAEEIKENQTMTATREFFNLETKNRFNAVQVDTDTSYYVKNVTDEKAAIKYALEKFMKKLETLGTQEARTIIEIIESCLSNDEFTESYNNIAEGGNAWEIEINDYNDGTMSIYIRIAECMHEDGEAVKEEETARAEEATNTDDYVTPFEAVKPHLFAKVEHIGEDFPTGSEWFGKRYGDDIAVTVWIDNGTAKPERLDRGTVHKWIDRYDVTILNSVFNTALENTIASEKPRLYKNIFTTDSAQIEETALLENFYAVKSLPDDKTPMITTSKQTGGAIACFYPPVCAKISELFGGTGFYVSFTSPNEGIIHAPGSIDISSIRRNLRETNNIFGMSGALTNDVFYYDPETMRLDAVK